MARKGPSTKGGSSSGGDGTKRGNKSRSHHGGVKQEELEGDDDDEEERYRRRDDENADGAEDSEDDIGVDQKAEDAKKDGDDSEAAAVADDQKEVVAADEDEEVNELAEELNAVELDLGLDLTAPPTALLSVKVIEEEEKVPTLKTVARWIRNGTCKRIVVLSGAGVSVSAGIPDFRTPGTGLYDNLQKYNLPYPEAVFDVNFYRRNPKPFVSLASEIWPGLKHSPTLAHTFIRLLDDNNLLLRNYTQNIDMLESLAGVTEEKLVECHGHFRTATCVECQTPHDGEACKSSIVHDRTAPKCTRCGGYVKPDIVFFGEGLPDRFGRCLRRDLDKADLLIVMGTSLMVAPVSLIPTMVPRSCPRVLLNRELVGDFGRRGAGGGWKGRGRASSSSGCDIFEAGDCDDSVRKLCEWIGWGTELETLNRSTRIL